MANVQTNFVLGEKTIVGRYDDYVWTTTKGERDLTKDELQKLINVFHAIIESYRWLAPIDHTIKSHRNVIAFYDNICEELGIEK